jgi:proline utilization trans-activator
MLGTIRHLESATKTLIHSTAKFGYWESLHLFSGLAILSISQLVISRESSPTSVYNITSDTSAAPVAGTSDAAVRGKTPELHPTNEIEIEDSNLFIRGLELLEEMARVGNPAAKDHVGMLSDVQGMVQNVLDVRHTNLSGTYLSASGATVEPNTDSGTYTGDSEPTFFDGLMDEQIWYDMDWENILKSWPRDHPN